MINDLMQFTLFVLILPLPFGDVRYAPITGEDQGRVIAAILNHPAEHAGKIYPLFGAKELSQVEIAGLLSKVLGRTITYVPNGNRRL